MTIKNRYPTPADLGTHRQALWIEVLHQAGHSLGLQQCQNQGRRRTEGRLPHEPGLVRAHRHVLQTHEFARHVPVDDERHLP